MLEGVLEVGSVLTLIAAIFPPVHEQQRVGVGYCGRKVAEIATAVQKGMYFFAPEWRAAQAREAVVNHVSIVFRLAAEQGVHDDAPPVQESEDTEQDTLFAD